MGDAAGSVSTDTVNLRKGYRERMVLDEVLEVGDSQRDGLKEVVLTLEEATVAVSTEGLKDADEEVGPEVVYPLSPLVAADVADIEIMAQQFTADGFGEIALGAVEQGGNVVLRGTATSALEVDVIQFVSHHDISSLEVAIHEIIGIGSEEVVGKGVEVVLKELLIKGYVEELEEVVLEVVEVPKDRLAIEIGTRVSKGEVEVGAPLLNGSEVGEGLLVEG